MGRTLTPHARANFSVRFRASFSDPEFRADEPSVARLEEIACQTYVDHCEAPFTLAYPRHDVSHTR